MCKSRNEVVTVSGEIGGRSDIALQQIEKEL